MKHVPPQLPSRPKRSDLAQLEFRWEPFHTLVSELPPLFKKHWAEIALDRDFVSLDPDWDSYFDLALRGRLHVLTARGKGVVDFPLSHQSNLSLPVNPLRGYVFNLIGGHLHYNSTLFAHTEMFWLDPAYRKGWLPVRMMLENLAGLKERGVEVATINFKLHFKDARVGKLLARLGYEPTDIVMRKVL